MALSALATSLLTLGLTTAPVSAVVTPPDGGWRWPVAGTPVVSRPFQPPPHPWAAGHRGVDLAAPPGATVLAAGAGVVSFAGYVAGIGVVAVLHHGGLRTTYEPVAPSVSAGQPVVAGDPLGRLLAGHGDCGPARWCLHWGLLRGAVYLDPLTLVRRGPVRLLPLTQPAVGGGRPAVLTSPGSAPAPVRPAAPGPVPAPMSAATPARARAHRGPGPPAAAVAAVPALAVAALAGRLVRRRGWRAGRVSPAGRRAWT